MRLAQESRHGERSKAIFKTKCAFNKDRMRAKTVYNSRSAYMKAHGANAVDVQEEQKTVKDASGGRNWLDGAQRLSAAGSNFVTFYTMPSAKTR